MVRVLLTFVAALAIVAPFSHTLPAATALPAAREAAKTGVYAAVVRIGVPGARGTSNGSGTLIAVNERYGYVLTAAHVLDGATGEPRVTFADGYQSPARIVKQDAVRDLALLRIDKPKARPVKLAAGVPRRGQPLTIAGYGDGPFRAARGVFRDFAYNGDDACWYDINGVEARQGDSGGPIFADDQTLAGCLWGSSANQTVGSHVKTIRSFLPAECVECMP